jgi:hypothetical protein
MSEYYKLTEEYVRQYVAENGDPEGNYATLFAKADIYKQAEMTPFFIFDAETNYVYVAAEETWGKRLH